MNKTVTTYAEKKAKQFLNLLQGYTKGIRFTAILILLLMGVSNVWGASVTPQGKYFYFKTSDTWKADGARFAVCFQWKDGGGEDEAWVSCTEVPNVTDMYYVQAPDKYWDIFFCRMNGSNQTNNWGNKWNQTDKLQYDGINNHWTKSSGWNGATTYSIYAPPMNSVTLENNGTNIVSGSGTSGDPYLVYVGTLIKVIASGTKAVDDPEATIYYDFKQGTTSQQNETTTTYSFTASSTVNTSYTINLDGYTKISSTSSTMTSATALYFKTIEENTYTVTVNNDGHGTTTPSGAQANVGQVTGLSITANPDANYEFVNWTITSGSGSFDSATSASTTFKPTSDATIQANFRSTATNNPCVYFVNTERWTTIYAHAWNDSENNGWPGQPMTKETEKISGFEVYKYVMPSGKNYDKLTFNQGKDDGQTGNLEWSTGKYYVYSAGQWKDKNEVADLLPKPVIYFKNHLDWDNVYVYFFETEKWGDEKGASPSGLTEENGRVCQMEKVGETDIYKFDYSEKDFVPGNVIAFSKDNQSNYDNFYETHAAYRSDYNPSMELYIPQKIAREIKNNTTYFNNGLWMKYNSMESGYTITGSLNGWNSDEDKFTSSSHTGYHFDIALSLGGKQTYQFKVKNIKNDWYGKQSTMITATKDDLELESGSGDTYNVQLTTTSAGKYIFSIDLTEGKMMLSVEYPLQVNDYRLVYVESEVSGKTPYTKFHPAQSIRYQATGEKKDTVSFYINKTTGKNPAILLQQCTAINGNTITWDNIAIQYINGNSGDNPVAALAPAKRIGELYVGRGADITTNGVYNFTLCQTDGNAEILNEETHPYEGDYYIRTDAADGGWRKYNTNPDNIMTHSQTALNKHDGYDYYVCKWVLAQTNVHYVVANKYSYCVSDTLTTDDIVTDMNGELPADANVRFTWNSETNHLERAYLAGSGIISDRYLVLIGNDNLKDISGNNFHVDDLNANEVAFKDMGNWLYQLDVKANQNTHVKLTADYNNKTQYFKGSADKTEQLIKGSDNDYTLRLIYDFKTNYLLSGLVGNQVITDKLELEEVMIARSHHEEAQTFQIPDNGSVTAKKAYGVMTFNKATLNYTQKSQHERALYWVSFPFDVKLDEAFGFGNYGEHWIMEYYDGAARAKNGAWVDSGTYWKYITNPKGYTLKAGEGYVLCLDLDLLGNNAKFWDHENTEIALYFPSCEENLIVINNVATQRQTTVPEYRCTIERDDRYIHDSNWNIIGVPAYTKIAEMVGKNIFYYQYNAAKNTYVSGVTPNFNTMHAYMVQYTGTINWTEQATSISALAARKSPTSKDQYTLRLALQQEGTDHDHTFIRLQEDNATAEFDMNYDLCKIINRGANIYSIINDVEVAANVLPVEERVIPLGLDIHKTGNYTFAMPDGTDGITAILIDYETGTETNLLLADYTTELHEGTNNERFALRVRPNHVATEVENTSLTDSNDNAKKYIIDGALYLLRDGKLYDAQGRMIQQ